MALNVQLRGHIRTIHFLETDMRKLESTLSENKQLVRNMLQGVDELRMSLGALKEVDSDIERLHEQEINTGNREDGADRNCATSHQQKAMEEIASDEKEECSPNFKNGQGERNSDKSHKTMISVAVVGTVKLFNIKNGYGFVTRNNTLEDVFDHRCALATGRRLGKGKNNV